MVKVILRESEERMKKALEFVKNEFLRIRTGRASTGLVDNVKIDYYGTPTPLNQVGNISIPDSQTIAIQPWDKSVISLIERAILNSDLGLNPSNDGNIVRIPIPPLNEERRKEYVKLAKKLLRRDEFQSEIFAGMRLINSRKRKRKNTFPKMSVNMRR